MEDQNKQKDTEIKEEENIAAGSDKNGKGQTRQDEVGATGSSLVLDNPKKAHVVVLATAFMTSVAGISYELLAATISSYFLGNAVLQYSLTIGVFLFAMGVGSYLSRKFEKNLVNSFLSIQISIGLVGGFSTLALFTAYKYSSAFSLVMYAFLMAIGALIGLEVPLLIRILKDYESVSFSIADVLSFDYVGALIASVLFPLFVLPHMGMMHASFFYALLNMVVVFMNLSVFHKRLVNRKFLYAAAFGVTLVLFGGLAGASSMVSFFEGRLYDDEVIMTRQTKYQCIVMTRYKDDLRLFLDGSIQFSSWDEYRYHEVLVHPAMTLTSNRENVIILGGGDGLAAREVLKYPDAKQITLVDIDGDMVNLCRTDRFISKLNGGSLSNPRVRVVIEDGFTYMQNSKTRYGVILVDLPDPKNESISKLYTRGFYNILKNHLARGGVICTQSTSPFFAREVFWCIVHTIDAVGLETLPMHVFVPSMGDWGFTLASNVKLDPGRVNVTVPTQFLRPGKTDFLFYFPKDVEEEETEINTLDTHKILQYYQKAWKMWE